MGESVRASLRTAAARDPGLAGRRIGIEPTGHAGRRGAGQDGYSVTALLAMHRTGIAEGGELGDRD